ncbi:sulfur carrier protein ThiS [Marinobacter sp. X15-166B]|uniref:sulfur carrier protein ThiS n=1 Tax=Marinobacter sp. X15-166B TaxID=1897620 RepID=UPI00085C8CB6|nr:sulfur carrier protein ThiS [Marinobacter sp. X15-166B]OEY67902.1 thiamine biosynthesis protein ThiS [Marinobacter sp. X15-166B]
MQVVVNGETMTLARHTRLTELLASLQLAGQRLAVEINEDIIPRSRHGETRLEAGDRIEVVHAIGGG